ncbi:MAG: excinuclease ABC subunit UvrC [Candidatus Saccharimonadales bacterium]
MTLTLQNKLKELPTVPGVYFHKSQSGEVIYVGKAANLKNRVRQYFQESRVRDVKTDALVAEIDDVEWIEVETELDALFLESEMIKRYMPRFNILLRDDKSQLFVRIPMREAYPAISFTRQPHDDDATYFGPYYNGWAIKKALRYLRRVFPYSVHERMPNTLCLQYHLGLCPGVEAQKTTSEEYKKTLKKLMRYLHGDRKTLIRELERDMKTLSSEKQYEEAAVLRNRLRDLKQLSQQIIFSDREFMNISKDHGLAGLQRLLGLKDIPRRIEGYDISHMSGTNNVASMVVATNGLADKSEYRKFKMQLPGNNDFGHMRETMRRRFSGRHTDWSKPDLILIDGGKGQLSAAIEALEELQITVPIIGLAKRDEQIVVHTEKSSVHLDIDAIKAWAQEEYTVDEVPEVLTRTLSSLSTYNGRKAEDVTMPGIESSEDFILITLAKSSHIVKLLQRIRNESHRFAVSYHSTLKRKGATKSILDTIPGVGPATRKKLIAVFGSGIGVQQATKEQLRAAMGEGKGEDIYTWLHPKE